MKVLVSCGAGFIGSHVAEYYAKKGIEVLVFDNLSRMEILRKDIGSPLFNWNYLKNNYPHVKPIKSSQLQAKARRPRFSALKSVKLPFRMRGWREALRAYLAEKGHLKG
ncbi:MAG: NAD-dependent epimerase/dehydratase family protein [Nitrososphaerales archaeon]